MASGAGWQVAQSDLTPSTLADLLQKTDRVTLLDIGLKAKKMQKTEATKRMVAACEELAT